MENTIMKAYLEITGIAHVTGKDENGADLPLTRVQMHRYDKNVDTGEIGPDHNDTGSTLFVGSIDLAAAVKGLTQSDAPDWNIEVIVGDGVQEAA